MPSARSRRSPGRGGESRCRRCRGPASTRSRCTGRTRSASLESGGRNLRPVLVDLRRALVPRSQDLGLRRHLRRPVAAPVERGQAVRHRRGHRQPFVGERRRRLATGTRGERARQGCLPPRPRFRGRRRCRRCARAALDCVGPRSARCRDSGAPGQALERVGALDVAVDAWHESPRGPAVAGPVNSAPRKPHVCWRPSRPRMPAARAQRRGQLPHRQ